MSKWVYFDEVTNSYPNSAKKTCTWIVYSTTNNTMLGKVAWHSHWRQYCFFPFKDTLYNAECLNDIAEFCRFNRNERNRWWGS